MTYTVVIFGATGVQGGSVVARLLAANKKSSTGGLYAIRAVTRNPSSEKAIALAAQDVEVVTADLDDYSSVLRAFEGAELAFGLTNFWDSFMAFQDAAKAASIEVQQGKHLVDAAAATPSLKHYIWSSLPCHDQSVPHMQSKVLVDEYLHATYPALAGKTTYLFVGWYATNLSSFDPPKKDNDGKGYVWRLPARKETRIPVVGETSVNTGVFVEAIFTHPDVAKGKYFSGTSEIMSFDEIISLWGKVAGVPARFEEVAFEEFKKTCSFGEAFGEEVGLNMIYLSAWDEGMKGWTKPGGKLVTKEELEINAADLVSAEDTFKAVDWSAYKL